MCAYVYAYIYDIYIYIYIYIYVYPQNVIKHVPRLVLDLLRPPSPLKRRNGTTKYMTGAIGLNGILKRAE